MSFLIRCPECGERGAYEFRFGGEVKRRPLPDASDTAWHAYLHEKNNTAGEQTEWLYHRAGCRRWMQAVRNTRTNEVLKTYIPE